MVSCRIVVMPTKPSSGARSASRVEPGGPRPTRRRGKALETAIKQAVVELLTENGVAGVTMDAVAARAQTSKPVLYRRWSDRAALLRDTLVPLAMQAIPNEDTGSYRDDMLAILNGWAAFFASPEGTIAPAIVGAMPHDPELADAFRSGVIGWRKQEMATVIKRGIERGEVRESVRYDIARELGQAVLWHRFLITGDPITPELVEHIVDHILIPYAGRHDEQINPHPPSQHPGRPVGPGAITRT
jgi:AcrR family transcriptional regulator